MDEKWLEISIDTPAEALEGVCNQLIAAGMSGLVIEEEQEFKQFLEDNRQYWDYVDEELAEQMRGVARVKFYVKDDDEGHRQLAEYTQNISYPYSACVLKENDWAHSWQKYYKPLVVGERLYVIPEWERDALIPAGRTALVLNPGLTFGTGSHASTQLCLSGVEQYVAQGEGVLDLGCGSGILSIAALLLGASEAMALDIDPKAVNAAYENAALNGVGKDCYTVEHGNVLGDQVLVERLSQKPYQLVLANIVADVIIPLSAMVSRWMTEDGVFLCSGIIDERGEEVAAALEGNGLHIINRWEKKGWVAYAAKRAPQ